MREIRAPQGVWIHPKTKVMKAFFLLFIFFQVLSFTATAQGREVSTRKTVPGKIQYGTASFYADKFEGRKTANGEIFSQKKMTAAHNSLPLGTFIRVTNLSNHKSVVVKVNDRLHKKNPRLVDLSRTAAKKLGYTNRGLTKVRVDVLDKNQQLMAVN
jgi:rare lipoprotein A